MSSPFRIAVINDELGQDFGRACEVASREFGMEWIELRGMWNKNILKLDASEVAEARRILEKYKLRVTDIASPLFKVDWPGAPTSKFSPKRSQFNADFTYDQQGEVLERSIALPRLKPQRLSLACSRPPSWSIGIPAMPQRVARLHTRTAITSCPKIALVIVTVRTLRKLPMPRSLPGLPWARAQSIGLVNSLRSSATATTLPSASRPTGAARPPRKNRLVRVGLE